MSLWNHPATSQNCSTDWVNLKGMSQQQQQYHGNNGDGAPDETHEAGQAQLNTVGTDDLLDEIDALLDTNTEEFVRSYVQKGGE